MEASEIKSTETHATGGRRIQLLKYGIQTSIKKCLSAVSYSRFEKILLPIARSGPDILKQIHKQMETQLKSNIDEEIKSMFEEENIISLMNNLDKIIQESNLDHAVEAWRPSGEPSKDVLPHLYSVKQKEKASLERILKEMVDKNKQLKEALLPRRKILEATKNELLQECYLSEEAANVVSHENLQKLGEICSFMNIILQE